MDKNEFLELYNKGLSEYEMATALNCSRPTIRRHRLKHNLLPSKDKKASITFLNSKSELVRLHNQGISDLEIANALNVRPSQIATWRNRLNLFPNKTDKAEKKAKRKEVVRYDRVRKIAENLLKRGFREEEVAEITGASLRTIQTRLATVNGSKYASHYKYISCRERLLELLNGNMSDTDILQELECSESSLSKWKCFLEDENLYTNKPIVTFDVYKGEITRLHSEGKDNCSIATQLNIPVDSVNNFRKKLELEHIPTEYYSGCEPLTGYSHEAFIGHLLGDGHLRRRKDTWKASGTIVHGIKQEEYLNYKMELFKNLVGTKHLRTNKDGHKSHEVTLKACDYLDFLYDRVYILNHDGTRTRRITEELLQEYTVVSLTFHFMDDGYKTSNTFGIACHCFDPSELEMFCIFLKSKFDIDAHVQCSTTVYIKTKSASRFVDLISPHLHETMLYKIPKKYLGNIKVHVKQDELLEHPEEDNQQPSSPEMD